MDKAQSDALRAPFPPEQIGKLPKAGMQLDYVSHAWVTERLLEVDPEWTWEPMGTDTYGIPVMDDAGGLWIRLTVGGVTRPGYGTGSGPEKVKIAIGDALRNAGMRFGLALALWEKETPEWAQDPPPKPAVKVKQKAADPDAWHTQDTPGLVESPPSLPGPGPITQGQVKLVNVLAAGAGIEDRALLHEGISKLVGREVNSVKHLTKAEAATVIESLQGRQP